MSIVLTLAVGPSAPLFCKVWCDSQQAAAAGCHHEDGTGSPGVAGDNQCDDRPVGLVGFVRDDGRRAADALDHQHAVALAPLRFTPPRTEIRSGHDPGQQPLLAARPLTIALRI